MHKRFFQAKHRCVLIRPYIRAQRLSRCRDHWSWSRHCALVARLWLLEALPVFASLSSQLDGETSADWGGSAPGVAAHRAYFYGRLGGHFASVARGPSIREQVAGPRRCGEQKCTDWPCARGRFTAGTRWDVEVVILGPWQVVGRSRLQIASFARGLPFCNAPAPAYAFATLVLDRCLRRVHPRQQVGNGPDKKNDGAVVFILAVRLGTFVVRLCVVHSDHRAVEHHFAGRRDASCTLEMPHAQ
jgi:hypothetical protein